MSVTEGPPAIFLYLLKHENAPAYVDKETFAIAGRCQDGVQTSVLPSFTVRRGQSSTCNEVTASQLWDVFDRDGSLSSLSFHNSLSSSPGDEVSGAAVCQKFVLEPREKKEIVFTLTWDIPYVRFGSGKVLLLT